MADRAAGVQLWEPAYTILKSRKPAIRMLDLKLAEHWQAFAGSRQIPYLGVAAHRGWVEKNRSSVPRLQAMYKEAAAWLAQNPEEGAPLIAPKGTAEERASMVELIKSNERLGMNVQSAADLRKELEAVYRAGMEVEYLPKMPSAATIYGGAA